MTLLNTKNVVHFIAGCIILKQWVTDSQNPVIRHVKKELSDRWNQKVLKNYLK